MQTDRREDWTIIHSARRSMESLCFRLPPSTLFRPSATKPRHRPAATSRHSGNVDGTIHNSSEAITPSRPLFRIQEYGAEEQQQQQHQQRPPRRSWIGSWIRNILRVRPMWKSQKESGDESMNELPNEGDSSNPCCCSCEEGVADDGDGIEMEINRDVFSKFLRKASLAETKFYAKMSYLAYLSYDIAKIKPAHLLEAHGLHFVTSSLERKKMGASDGKEKQQPGVVASAASFLPSHSRPKDDGQRATDLAQEASFVVTTESVAAVVATEEEVKQAVAKDLNSSSPCQWFICDDDTTATRYFVIQGSKTLTSWKANLLFEPIQFEGLDVLVHRGVYETAKGIYSQMLPEIKAHLETRGSTAKLRFTGHSLGGSLSLLINLMLLIQGEAPASALLPVITFGAPSILCGGNALLETLSLPRNHLQAIILHRDIVPRAFSCTYPDRVADILKAVDGKFREHPCLKQRNMLYSPMGQILILQPEESFSPHHHLLPSDTALYFLAMENTKLLREAFSVFLNNPHPLQILRDRSAYGAGGSVIRDHNINSYFLSVQAVIRAEYEKLTQRHSKIWSKQ